MAGFTDYFINHLLDYGLSATSWTPPTAIYVSLHTGDPGPNGQANLSATTLRKLVTFTTASNGAKRVAADVTWAMTAPDSIAFNAFWDATTGGNCLFTNPVEDVKNFYAGDNCTLVAGTTVTIPAAA